MARPQNFPAQGETPARIADGDVVEIQTIFARNPGAAGAYVKIYAGTTPTGASVPIFSAWVPANSERVLPLFIGGGLFWLAVATEAGAGLTAPNADFAVSITYQ